MKLSSFLAIASSTLAACSHTPTASLPSWVTSQIGSGLIVCSAEGLDPQQLQEVSESKCLASAARSSGVSLTMKQKTLQSLSGSDSGESTEAAPIHAKVHCSFRYRHLEMLSSGGYRLWLGCVPKAIAVKEEKIDEERSLAQAAQKLQYKRGMLQLTCSPAPDKVIVGGGRGERVIEGGSTTLTLELREGDEWIELRKQRYQPKRLPIGEWDHGASLTEAVLLDPEI